ncbi:MAG TPA: ribbon-helix-helix domain-containing protein [Actinotalea sp.]|jgi:Arc/MetJ-type ribon-helix-helix transcriptional regulator
MKLSVSLSEADVAALDKYAHAAGLSSRSAAIQQAIRLLGDPELEDSYAAAWDEWAASGDAAAWESTAADGLADAAR